MWILAARDGILFLTGLALIGKELVTKNPDPFILEIGAGLTGTPGLLHHLKIRSTGTTSERVPQSSQPESQSTE